MTPNIKTGGFSLIELVIAISILTFIFSLGLLLSFDSFNGTIFRSERENIVSALEIARSRSLNNYLETYHGVCLDTSSPSSPKYINFQGTYSPLNPSNEYLTANSSVSITSTSNRFSCTNGGIVFSQLSGETSNISINIVQAGRTTIVSTNTAGRIEW